MGCWTEPQFTSGKRELTSIKLRRALFRGHPNANVVAFYVALEEDETVFGGPGRPPFFYVQHVRRWVRGPEYWFAMVSHFQWFVGRFHPCRVMGNKVTQRCVQVLHTNLARRECTLLVLGHVPFSETAHCGDPRKLWGTRAEVTAAFDRAIHRRTYIPTRKHPRGQYDFFCEAGCSDR